MTKQQSFARKYLRYPHLSLTIEAMIQDNWGCRARHPKSWQWPDGINYEELEEQASRMNEEEKEVFVAGEMREQQALTKRLKIQRLSKFIEEVFDGEYSWHFMPDPEARGFHGQE